MRHLPKLLLLLSLPVGLVGYAIGVQLVTVLAPSLADGVVVLFVALFLGGLCMVPFVLPFIDQKAKADLAAHRARQAAEGVDGDRPGDAPDRGRTR